MSSSFAPMITWMTTLAADAIARRRALPRGIELDRPFGHAVGEQKNSRVGAEDQEKAQDEREGEPERSDQRRQRCVQDRHDGGDEQGAPEALDGSTRRRMYAAARSASADTIHETSSELIRSFGAWGCQATYWLLVPRSSESFLSERCGRIRWITPPFSAPRSARFCSRFAARCSFCSAIFSFASTYDCPISTFRRSRRPRTARIAAKATFRAVVILAALSSSRPPCSAPHRSRCLGRARSSPV